MLAPERFTERFCDPVGWQHLPEEGRPFLGDDRKVLKHLSATLGKEFLTKGWSELKTFPD